MKLPGDDLKIIDTPRDPTGIVGAVERIDDEDERARLEAFPPRHTPGALTKLLERRDQTAASDAEAAIRQELEATFEKRVADGIAAGLAKHWEARDAALAQMEADRETARRAPLVGSVTAKHLALLVPLECVGDLVCTAPNDRFDGKGPVPQFGVRLRVPLLPNTPKHHPPLVSITSALYRHLSWARTDPPPVPAGEAPEPGEPH